MPKKPDANLDIGARDLTKAAFKSVKNSFNNLNKTVSSSNKLFKGMIALYAANKVVGMGKEFAGGFIDAADKVEQYRLRLEQLLGTQSEANKVFQDTAKYAATVSHTYDEAMNAASRFATITKDTDEINKLLKITGDLAAVSGIEFENMAQQIIRGMSAGAGAMDLARDRGVTAMLGFQAKVAYSAEETKNKIISEYEKIDSSFRGMSGKLSKTWSGLMSMYSDRWMQFRANVMNAGVFEYLKATAEVFLDYLDGGTKKSESNYKHWSDFIVNSMKVVMLASADLFDFIVDNTIEIRKFSASLGETFRADNARQVRDIEKEIKGFTTKIEKYNNDLSISKMILMKEEERARFAYDMEERKASNERAKQERKKQSGIIANIKEQEEALDRLKNSGYYKLTYSGLKEYNKIQEENIKLFQHQENSARKAAEKLIQDVETRKNANKTSREQETAIENARLSIDRIMGKTIEKKGKIVELTDAEIKKQNKLEKSASKKITDLEIELGFRKQLTALEKAGMTIEVDKLPKAQRERLQYLSGVKEKLSEIVRLYDGGIYPQEISIFYISIRKSTLKQ